MNQKVDDQTAFEIARQMALKKIDDNPSGDGYSVLMLKDNPTWLVGEASLDAAQGEARDRSGQAGARQRVLAGRPEHDRRQADRGEGDVSRCRRFISSPTCSARPGRPSPAEAKVDPDGQGEESVPGDSEQGDHHLRRCRPGQGQRELRRRRPGVRSGGDALCHHRHRCAAVGAGAEFWLRSRKRCGPRCTSPRPPDPDDPPMQFRVYPTDRRESEGHRTAFDPHLPLRENPLPVGRAPMSCRCRIGDDALVEDNTRSIVISVRDTVPGPARSTANRRPSDSSGRRSSCGSALNPFPAGAETKGFPLRPKVVNSLGDVHGCRAGTSTIASTFATWGSSAPTTCAASTPICAAAAGSSSPWATRPSESSTITTILLLQERARHPARPAHEEDRLAGRPPFLLAEHRRGRLSRGAAGRVQRRAGQADACATPASSNLCSA